MTLKVDSRQSAFTLAELLVTLGLLGVIAAFTIPKLVNATNAQEREANLRKGIFMIQTLVDDGVRTGDLTDTNVEAYFLDNVKAARKCRLNYVAQNCYVDIGDGDPAAGFVLPGGLTIVDFESENCVGNVCGESIQIDWNGKTAPNVEGTDRMRICFSYGTDDWNFGGEIIPPGAVVPCPDSPNSVALYNAVMNTN